MRKRVKRVPGIPPLHSQTKICCKKTQFRWLFWTVMGNIATMMRRTRNASAFCPFKGDILWHYIPFRSGPSRPRPTFSKGLDLLVWCTPGFVWQLLHLFKWTALTVQLHQSSFFNRTKHAKCEHPNSPSSWLNFGHIPLCIITLLQISPLLSTVNNVQHSCPSQMCLLHYKVKNSTVAWYI